MPDSPRPTGPLLGAAVEGGSQDVWADWRALPKDVRTGILGGRLPTDPRQFEVARRWARVYPGRARLQLLTAVVIAVVVVLVLDGPLVPVLVAMQALSLLGVAVSLRAARRVSAADPTVDARPAPPDPRRELRHPWQEPFDPWQAADDPWHRDT